MKPLHCTLAVCVLALLPFSLPAAEQALAQKTTAPKPVLTPKLIPVMPVAPTVQKTVSPKRSGPPYSIMVPAAFTVTGTGALETRKEFTPKALTTSEFTVTGTGALAVRAEFAPKTFTAPAFTVTGTDSLR